MSSLGGIIWQICLLSEALEKQQNDGMTKESMIAFAEFDLAGYSKRFWGCHVRDKRTI